METSPSVSRAERSIRVIHSYYLARGSFVARGSSRCRNDASLLPNLRLERVESKSLAARVYNNIASRIEHGVHVREAFEVRRTSYDETWNKLQRQEVFLLATITDHTNQVRAYSDLGCTLNSPAHVSLPGVVWPGVMPCSSLPILHVHTLLQVAEMKAKLRALDSPRKAQLTRQANRMATEFEAQRELCLLYTSPSPRD